jgi:long-chain acyl-CoA synthetase
MELIERERATVFMGVPYVFALAHRQAEAEGVKQDIGSLRLCVSAGSALLPDTAERFKRCYGLDIIQYYGLTESLGCVTCQPIDGSGKFNSVGKAVPGYELGIVNDSGKALPPGEVGEVIVRGPMMKGYYKNPQATASAIKDGWLYTGDMGRIDEDSYLFLTGVKKEMVITKGQNIYPSDIEDVLLAHPKVAEAAVVGAPDELRGEVVRAVISLKKGESVSEEEIIKFCREYLADYKLPKQVILVDSLPKDASGKIRKEELKSLSS